MKRGDGAEERERERERLNTLTPARLWPRRTGGALATLSGRWWSQFGSVWSIGHAASPRLRPCLSRLVLRRSAHPPPSQQPPPRPPKYKEAPTAPRQHPPPAPLCPVGTPDTPLTLSSTPTAVQPGPVYVDYNASTPIAREVADAMAPYLYEHWGNPSSAYVYGRRTAEAVANARRQLAALLNAQEAQAHVTFTSGGTESNNWAIRGAARAMRAADKKRSHIVTTCVEHPAVLEVCRFLRDVEGFELTEVAVDAEGVCAVEALEEAIRPGETALVTVMHSNNEVGALMPVREAAGLAHAAGALCHTDASQSVGKVPVDFVALGVDFLTVAGHKMYAPKGCGALIHRRDVPMEKFMIGAGHEQGRVRMVMSGGPRAMRAQKDYPCKPKLPQKAPFTNSAHFFSAVWDGLMACRREQ